MSGLKVCLQGFYWIVCVKGWAEHEALCLTSKSPNLKMQNLICLLHTFLKLSSGLFAPLPLWKNSAAGSGGKQATKTSIHCGKSLRGGDSAAAGSQGPAGGGVSFGHRGGQQAATKTSNPVKPALRLRSSQSFSSLQSTSLTAAPFMRSSRSLSRLDQRSPGNYPRASFNCKFYVSSNVDALLKCDAHLIPADAPRTDLMIQF